MRGHRKSFLIGLLSTIALISVAGVYFCERSHDVAERSRVVRPRPFGVPEDGEAPLFVFKTPPTKDLSREAAHQFLEADFSNVQDLAELPPAILRSLTKIGGSRLVIANPGQDFPQSGLSSDPDRRWLIFAGMAGDRGFVHYQEAGFGPPPYNLVLFRVTSTEEVLPVWHGQCRGAAKNLEQLKDGILYGACHHALPLGPFLQPPISADGSTVFPAHTKIIPVKFIYINCEEPTCPLPAATIELKRAVGKTFVPVDEDIYSTQGDRNSSFASYPATGEYEYNIAASQLRRGKYRVNFMLYGRESRGNAIFAIR
jgi:hypothetical protein